MKIKWSLLYISTFHAAVLCAPNVISACFYVVQQHPIKTWRNDHIFVIKITKEYISTHKLTNYFQKWLQLLV